ncbi:hypothetical protein KUTeg_011455 [Tegillarca granosa]|uniref:Uncharacterized protein n=1 Tax=Tegillarca granosa TaxID=220873 RepID=A0ABQ9F627_TEGGR|nr:hypothetical protein KUTeg_011455 [Tegillarca granosa]
MTELVFRRKRITKFQDHVDVDVPKSKIVKIKTSGQHIRTIQHDPVDNKQLFDEPRLICTNINGDIIVTENAKVVAVSHGQQKRFVYHAEGRQLKYLFNSQCIVIDKHGLIIISDYYNSVVHVLDKDGKFIQFMVTQEQGYKFGFHWI